MEGAARGENSKFIREKLPEMKSLWTAKGAGHFAWRLFMCAGLQYCPVNIIQARDSRPPPFCQHCLLIYCLFIYRGGRSPFLLHATATSRQRADQLFDAVSGNQQHFFSIRSTQAGGNT